MEYVKYAGEWPWHHAVEKWYDDGRLVKRHDWNDYNHSWDYTQEYKKIGDKNLMIHSQREGQGNYEITFEFYPNGKLKTALFKSTYGEAKLHYSKNGKLEILEKKENGKWKTFHYTYIEEKKVSSTFSAKDMYERYESQQYIDNTGGYSYIDAISSVENFEKMKKQGIIVTSEKNITQRPKKRKVSKKETLKAFSMLRPQEFKKSSTIVYNRLEYLQTEGRQIGTDIMALDNGLIAVARMYEHTSWERGDAGWAPHGNGTQWTYEIVGAVIDLEKEKIIRDINFSHVVRDAYDGSKDTYSLIDPTTMLRTNDTEVEFFMGDKYHTIASQKFDILSLKKLSDYREHAQTKNKERSSQSFSIKKERDDR